MKIKPLNVILLQCCFLFLHFAVFSQGLNRDSGQIASNSNIGFISGDHLPDSFLKSDKKVIEYKNIEGSPYVNNNSGTKDQLPIGKIYTEQYEYIGTSFVRYNAYTDHMEVSLVDDGVDYYHLEKKPDFLYVVLRKKKYRAYEYKKVTSTTIGYFVILSETDTSNCTFLKKEKVLFKKETAPESSFLSATPAHFTRTKDTYHLKFSDGKLVGIPKKNKDFILLFSKHRDKVKAYITDHKLKVKNTEHVLKIVNYFNSLSS